MAVSQRHRDAGVAEQLAHGVQIHALRYEFAGEGVPEVVEPKAVDLRGPHEREPGLLDVVETIVISVAAAWKYIVRAIRRRSPRRQRLHCFAVQRHVTRLTALGTFPANG